MRQTYNSEMILEKGNFVGFSLGADFCAEHEWGIENLARTLGLCPKENYDKVIGIDRYVNTKEPNAFKVLPFQKKNKKYVSLIVHSSNVIARMDNDKLKQVALPVITSNNEDKISNVSWDSNGFAIVVPYVYRESIYALEKAIKDKNLVVLFINNKDIFNYAGYCVMIRSAIPERVIKYLYDRDTDYLNLLNEVKKTGIEEILKKSNVGSYSLSPRWTKGEKNTKYPVVFWLNPFKQELYNYGWFTVEELLEWSQGKGPIIKK